MENALKHFYIAEEQSIYLLSQDDALKLRKWVKLCEHQLEHLGYRQIELIGKGAYGFVFAGKGTGADTVKNADIDQQDRKKPALDGRDRVFKFSRITLPEAVQSRLEEEAFMQSQVCHPRVPRMIAFERIRKQAILMMERAPGQDLERISLAQGPLPPKTLITIAVQLAEILTSLRQRENGERPIIHGDIKPSNIVYDQQTQTLELVDWGSSVFAQIDENGQHVSNNVQDLMSCDLQQTNARLGDVYFIGPEQLNGALSSPRFDEQGVASTLYALASGQSCRFGRKVIPARSLGLPIEFARMLDGMLSEDKAERDRAGDYFLKRMPQLRHLYFARQPPVPVAPMIPVWLREHSRSVETVVYSSRRSFLMEGAEPESIRYLNDVQLDKYYKNFLAGMGETEKAFIAAVSRLGRYPVVGGLALHWQQNRVDIDASLNLYDANLKPAFDAAVNNLVILARGISREGTFKTCIFDARNTIHIDREQDSQPFVPEVGTRINYEVQPSPKVESHLRHSYFEDGRDPDEQLELPDSIIEAVEKLNTIHHTGCIIFESLPKHLKIHSYYMLLDDEQESRFADLLGCIIDAVPQITGTGTAGYMKLPYKNTRSFDLQAQLPEQYYPRDPRPLDHAEPAG